MNIQQIGLPNVRKSCQRSRLVSLLASSVVIGVLLVGGLLGFRSYQAASASASAKTSIAATCSGVVKSDDEFAESGSESEISYRDIACQAAVKVGINPQYFIKQIQEESGFNPQAISPAGAEGIAQFMPATAASLGIDPWNPTQALNGAAELMASLQAQFGGSYAMALAAYNAGPGTVQYAINAGGDNWLAYTPAETQHYVASILGWMEWSFLRKKTLFLS